MQSQQPHHLKKGQGAVSPSWLIAGTEEKKCRLGNNCQKRGDAVTMVIFSKSFRVMPPPSIGDIKQRHSKSEFWMKSIWITVSWNVLPLPHEAKVRDTQLCLIEN